MEVSFSIESTEIDSGTYLLQVLNNNKTSGISFKNFKRMTVNPKDRCRWLPIKCIDEYFMMSHCQGNAKVGV